jgi:NAD(P)H dehydrogenase (quinone)
MMRLKVCLKLVITLIVGLAYGVGFGQQDSSQIRTILITYVSNSGNTEKLAKSVYKGATENNSVHVVLKSVSETTNEDVILADAIILGSPVYNANPAPELLTFIQGWPFEKTPLQDKIGAVFVTAGGISSGEELVQNALQNAMLIFGMVVVGGGEWTTPFGASSINEELKGYPERDDLFSKKGEQLGRRVRDAVLRWNAK